METFLTLAALTAFLIAAGWAYRRLAEQRLSRERLFEPVAGEAEALPEQHEAVSGLGWWLYKAGYRSPDAAATFLTATGGCILFGALATWVFYHSPALAYLIRGLEEMPGGLGDIFKPFAFAMPWIVLVTVSALPWFRVRAARRKRVARIEQDLPITLELLATLAEAGIGFDAALERILDSQPADRPLAEEFRLFQLEVLAGRPRIECLRRLGRRIDVSSLTLFISALVQASQVGSGVSEVLRRQVEELRNRRRENALTKAASLPIKLLFPLVICFLPGLFVAVLGPALYQVFQFMDQVSRNRGGIR